MTTQMITCPSCGHHIANMTSVAPQPSAAPAPTEWTDLVDASVGPWVARLEPGTYEAGVLREAFSRDVGMPLSAKAFGQALQRAGAIARRGTAGVRLWEVRGEALLPGAPQARDVRSRPLGVRAFFGRASKLRGVYDAAELHEAFKRDGINLDFDSFMGLVKEVATPVRTTDGDERWHFGEGRAAE